MAHKQCFGEKGAGEARSDPPTPDNVARTTTAIDRPYAMCTIHEAPTPTLASMSDTGYARDPSH